MIVCQTSFYGLFICSSTCNKTTCFTISIQDEINMTGAWDKEKNLSPQQEMNPWPPEHCVGALHVPTELKQLMESEAI